MEKKQRDNSVFFRSEFLRFVLFYQYFLNHCHVMGMAGYGYWFCLAVLSMGSILYTIVSSWSIKICHYMGFQSWEDASHWGVCVMHTIDACTPPCHSFVVEVLKPHSNQHHSSFSAWLENILWFCQHEKTLSINKSAWQQFRRDLWASFVCQLNRCCLKFPKKLVWP